jgi:hypothetical protein
MFQNRISQTHRRIIIYSVGLLMVALALWLQIPTNVSAAIACQGSGAFFAGTQPINQQLYGVRANITVRNPYLCTTPNSPWSASFAWVMIANNARTGYAQAGYVKMYGNSQSYTFSEYDQDLNNPPSFTRKVFSAASGSPLYKVLYSKATGKLSMYSDSTYLDVTNFDPTIAWGPASTWNPQYEGETHDNGDDIPGTMGSQVYFQNMSIKTSVNYDTWSAPVSSVMTIDPLYRYSVVQDNSSQIRIWTK